MKLKTTLLPLFTAAFGTLGILFRFWNNTAGTDGDGLIISGHPSTFAMTALMVLMAVLLIFVALFMDKKPSGFQKSKIAPINGGALRNAYIRLPKLGEVAFSRNVPLHKEARAGIYDLIGLFNDGPVKLFPFTSVGNGDYFCFDLTTNTVVLYLHEIDKTIYVCDSFSQLLSMLVTE